MLVAGGVTQIVAEPFLELLDDFAPVHEAWISSIDPGGFIVRHVDGAPYHERWQVPISTAGSLNGVTATDGVPFRVEHWQPHAVVNDTDRPRIHIVIDRLFLVDAPAQPFTVYPE